MISGFIVKKGSMTSIFTPEGNRVSVTRCLCPSLKVTQIKTKEKDGYSSIQISYGTAKKSNRKEFFLTSEVIPEIGSDLAIDSIFQVGDSLQATGLTKGRGFAGVIKRHHFQRQPVSGGQSDRVRAPGSIGAQTPGKVVRGKKMPGHMGNSTKTITGLKIVAIDKDTQTLSVSGSIPGHINSYLILTKE